MRGETTLEVLIEQGMPEGHEVTFEMEADESPDVLPGDVTFKIISQPHHLFKRNGDDLSMVMKITLLEALVGFKKTFRHMDDHEVEVSRMEVTPHGHVMIVKDEGMPKHNVPSEVGVLRITFEVIFPRRLTSQQADDFRRVFA
jgi:DnaJ-class molecular chaperone